MPFTRPLLRTALWVFLFVNCICLLTTTGRVRTTDEVMTYFITESLATHGTSAVPQAVSANLFYGKYDRAGVPRAPYAPGQALAALPWFFAGKYILNRLPGIPADSEDIVMGFAVTSSSTTFAAISATLLFLLFSSFGLTTQNSLLTTALVFFGTPLFAYSGWFFSEPLTTALFLGAALFLFASPPDVPITTQRAMWAGILLGVALWVRPTQLIAVPVFALALLFREWPRANTSALRTAFSLCFSSGIFGLLYLANNKRLFGDPFDFGYPAMAESGRHLNGFTTPFLTGFSGFLISPGKSIFLFAPLLFVALAGLRRFWDRDRGLAVLAAGMPLMYLLFYSTYAQWEGGYCFGPRYLVPALPFLAFAIAPLFLQPPLSANALGAAAAPRLFNRMQFTAIFFAGIGLVINLIGLSTSFLEDQARRGVYYDSQFNYVWDHSPITAQLALLFKYFSTGASAPIGLGFDRWFVFLHKGGVADATLFVVALVPAFGLLFSGWKLLTLKDPNS